VKCPHCERETKGLVTETRSDTDGSVFRRRYCGLCFTYFVTKEAAGADLKMPTQARRVGKKQQRY